MKRFGDRYRQAQTYHYLGRLAMCDGRVEEARQDFDQSMKLKRVLGDAHGWAETALEVGRMELEGSSAMQNRLAGFRYWHAALQLMEALEMSKASEYRGTCEQAPGYAAFASEGKLDDALDALWGPIEGSGAVI